MQADRPFGKGRKQLLIADRTQAQTVRAAAKIARLQSFGRQSNCFFAVATLRLDGCERSSESDQQRSPTTVRYNAVNDPGNQSLERRWAALSNVISWQ
jgi:hypothetical protein